MSRNVRHFSLHRIAHTELRVVADIDDSGVLPIIQFEEAVIRSYVNHANWPHQWVMLYILDDFQPLIRQLRSGVNPAILEATGYNLSPESAAVLNKRPVVNLFDLSNLTGCNIFVNRRAMLDAGYWKDHLAIEALLAHEHAHPLAENDATRASRGLKLRLNQASVHPPNLQPVLAGLAENLCKLAPREVFANQTTLLNGYAKALYHLNRHNLINVTRGIATRKLLLRQLQNQIAAGNLSEQDAGLLAVGGDLSAHLPLAMEIAPFYRAGLAAEGEKLENALNQGVFPHIEPLTRQAFQLLLEAYIALQPDAASLTGWAEGVLTILAESFAQKGLNLDYRLEIEM